MEEKIKTNKFKDFNKALSNLLKKEGIIKKTILWALLVLLVFLFISVVVTSFDKDH